MIECAACRRNFDPAEVAESSPACEGCGMMGTSCGKVRCPHCGYDNPRPLPDVRKAFRDFWRRWTDGASTRGH